MRVTFAHPAQPGELWAQQAADSMPGQSFVWARDGEPLGVGVVHSARVLDGGTVLEVCVELPDGLAPQLGLPVQL